MKKLLAVVALIGAILAPTLASAQAVYVHPQRPSAWVQARDAATTTLAVVGTVALICKLVDGCGRGIPYGAPMYVGQRMVRTPCGTYPAGLEHLCNPTSPAVTVIIIDNRR